MPDDLEGMLARAKAAQGNISETKKSEAAESKAASEAEFSSKLQGREVQLGEAAAAHGEYKKTLALIAEARKSIETESSVSEEMKAFLQAAEDQARNQQEKELELMAKAEGIDADPAVYAALQEQANEMNGRKGLNKKFYQLENAIRGELTNHNSKHGDKYHANIAGHHSQDDPESLLEMYGSMATGEWHDVRDI